MKSDTSSAGIDNRKWDNIQSPHTCMKAANSNLNELCISNEQIRWFEGKHCLMA